LIFAVCSKMSACFSGSREPVEIIVEHVAASAVEAFNPMARPSGRRQRSFGVWIRLINRGDDLITITDTKAFLYWHDRPLCAEAVNIKTHQIEPRGGTIVVVVQTQSIDADESDIPRAGYFLVKTAQHRKTFRHVHDWEITQQIESKRAEAPPAP
jgi:hypothetical protein